MKYLMAEEEPLLPDTKQLNIESMSELLVLCKGIPSSDALKSLESLEGLYIYDLPELKGICSRVLICNALETISIKDCPELKKLPFCVDNLPCALKEIRVLKEWWDAVEWDHPRTKAHFDSIPKKCW
ncbi:hypothetical protein MRB53_021784 [Persea americana]|uniref:Uncharacterized protein n=1 Tax=Persea americana TaxID=3435 RepID=A0ACC2L549_PERAE|nr:hypothetical protein MRB53_021784 [Persea americana]